MNKKIAIIAANFTGNKGAAAMLKSIIKNLDSEYNGLTYNLLSVYPKNDRIENPFKNVKVISCKPQEIIFIGFSMAILFFLFKWLKPVRKFLLKYKILKGLYEADLVVDAAGISFVDSRGFIMNTYNFICVATPLLLGKTIIKYSQAMGPFNSFWNRTLAKIVLPKIHTICARGEITRFHLDKLNLKNITTCADGAFSLPDDPEALRKIRNLIKDDDFYNKKIISISPSSVLEKQCFRIGTDYKNIITCFINYLTTEKKYGVLIIANSARKGSLKSHNNDLLICQDIFDRVQNKNNCRWYNDIFTPEEIRELIGLSSLMVASRFHSMIGALNKKVPIFLVGWSHKYKEVLDMFALGENAIDYKELNFERLVKEFISFENRAKEIKSKIEESLPGVVKSSIENIEIIKEVLEKVKRPVEKTLLDYNNPQKYIGDFTNLYIGYSNNPNIREDAASGGIVSSVLIYLLEKGVIDGALVSKSVISDGHIGVKTFIAKSSDEILDCRGSIYMDFPMTKCFKDILKFDGKVAVVALPCWLETLEKLELKYPELKEKIALKIGLFCSGNNSSELVEKVLKKNRVEFSEMKRIFFRRGHWRGKTVIVFNNGSEKNIPYLQNIATYRNLYYFSLKKCYSCQNHFGYDADMSFGDVWLSEMKYNPIKHNAVICKNEIVDSILNDMTNKNIISLQKISEKKILKSQKRSLVYKFNTAYARKKVGKLFGLNCYAKNLEKSKWNHYVAAYLIALNIRFAKSKIVDMIPNKLLFLYMGFLRLLLSF